MYRYGHESQCGMTIWTNCQSCFNSMINMKLVKNSQVVLEEKLFNNIMILYIYTVQGQGKITLTE